MDPSDPRPEPFLYNWSGLVAVIMRRACHIQCHLGRHKRRPPSPRLEETPSKHFPPAAPTDKMANEILVRAIDLYFAADVLLDVFVLRRADQTSNARTARKKIASLLSI